MIWAKNLKKSIFSLEGDWDRDLTSKNGVKYALDYLNANLDIDVIHRNCGTEDNFNYYLKEYLQPKYDNYTILYLAFHGWSNQLKAVDAYIELEDISEMCENSLRGKIVYFASCLTLNIEKKRIVDFLNKTKALAVFGYEESIDFNESMAMDILVMPILQKYKDMRKVEKDINNNYSQLADKLKFKMIY